MKYLIVFLILTAAIDALTERPDKSVPGKRRKPCRRRARSTPPPPIGQANFIYYMDPETFNDTQAKQGEMNLRHYKDKDDTCKTVWEKTENPNRIPRVIHNVTGCGFQCHNEPRGYKCRRLNTVKWVFERIGTLDNKWIVEKKDVTVGIGCQCSLDLREAIFLPMQRRPDKQR